MRLERRRMPGGSSSSHLVDKVSAGTSTGSPSGFRPWKERHCRLGLAPSSPRYSSASSCFWTPHSTMRYPSRPPISDSRCPAPVVHTRKLSISTTHPPRWCQISYSLLREALKEAARNAGAAFDVENGVMTLELTGDECPASIHVIVLFLVERGRCSASHPALLRLPVVPKRRVLAPGRIALPRLSPAGLPTFRFRGSSIARRTAVARLLGFRAKPL